ncbi:DUF4397 domain-containing protein [Cellulophaga sp. BC115SP]|uniref:DUF4397 domain-containing protein n=1 Tax=Cellulophaga sp. BC115SP TaxID=2683263 RepID=UPI0014124902|nr:DUF4397 domain-containing protein [Cellulophaga sp. BC115SP]NBB30383.1 DUF4397 domain-containing protein [Cellulophaga sp. BC115SP]
MTYKRFLSILTLATSIFGLAACGEQADSFQNILPATGSRLKFIHAAPDVAGVDIYLNDKKFSGVNTTPPAAPNLLTYGNAFPLTAEYATYPAGATKVGVVIPSLNNAVGLTANVNLEDGKYYSVFATGVSPNYSAVALEDKFPAANGKNIYVRVLNLVSNSTTIDFTVNGQTIATNIAYKNADNTFYTVPIDNFLSGTITVPFITKVSGGVALVTTATVNQTLVVPGKCYTVYVRGMVTTDAKNPTKYAPTASVLVNR